MLKLPPLVVRKSTHKTFDGETADWVQSTTYSATYDDKTVAHNYKTESDAYIALHSYRYAMR